MVIEGKIVDIQSREIFSGSVEVENGSIIAINRYDNSAKGYIMMGFIDSHVHIESSLLTPVNFGEMVKSCGTVAVVTDPHEIANVLGREGIDFMVENSKKSAISIHFSIPSCVPATSFDIAGGEISAEDVEQMAATGEFVALSEVMNVPGVLYGDEKLHKMIKSAHNHNIVVDGHAPLLLGDDLQQYIDCGITTDHECSSLEEAKEKIRRGMKVLIRESSAAKNYEALKSLIASHPGKVMFCTDDAHPDELLSLGHIDKIIRRAIADGFDIFDVLRIASQNPIDHYSLPVGNLTVGSSADFIIVENLKDFKVLESYVRGNKIFDREIALNCCVESLSVIPNNFNHNVVALNELTCSVKDEIPVIGLINDELITQKLSYKPKFPTENLENDLCEDILKIVYINRYNNTPPKVAYIKGFGLKKGALASSVAHDSHNIVAVGVTDQDLCSAINSVIASKGGLVVVDGENVEIIKLPIAGIMSTLTGGEAAEKYASLEHKAKSLGSTLRSPFMTLSFMSLVVIPELKIGERGLFSFTNFDFLKADSQN